MVTVAVVGAGVFGCTTAVELAQSGCHVTLFEGRDDILEGTTARCQARLHSGYHYPRSDSTAWAAKQGALEFSKRFPEAVINDYSHYYVIANSGKTSPDDYLEFCRRLDLPYVEERPFQVHSKDLCLKVEEQFVDVPKLRTILRHELNKSNVIVRTSESIQDPDQLSRFDWIIWTTYGNHWKRPIRYEVCEVAVLEVGRYQQQSFVVLDGDFTSFNSYGRYYQLYDVQHSVHHTETRVFPFDVPAPYDSLIKKSALPLYRPQFSRVPEMIQSAGRFLWGLDPRGGGVSIYVGSLWSVRAVLPDVDASDERPTIIDQQDNCISILSGKICTAVSAARQVTEMVT